MINALALKKIALLLPRPWETEDDTVTVESEGQSYSFEKDTETQAEEGRTDWNMVARPRQPISYVAFYPNGLVICFVGRDVESATQDYAAL